MIIGRGLLARSFAADFAHDPDVVVFASGVSNSQEADPTAFERERQMLDEALATGRRLVYFGSCGVVAADEEMSPYMRHKRAMEARVLARGDNLVLRLPQVVARTDNPHTLVNFLVARILRDEPFSVWSGAERNLVDIDDVVAIGRHWIRAGGTGAWAIASATSLPMPQIVRILEQALDRPARYTIVDRASHLPIDRPLLHVAEALGIDMGPDYAERVLHKYCQDATALQQPRPDDALCPSP